MGLCRWGGVVDVREAAENDDPKSTNQPTNQLQPKSIEAHRATQAGNEQAVMVLLNVASSRRQQRSRHQSPQQVLLLLS